MAYGRISKIVFDFASHLAVVHVHFGGTLGIHEKSAGLSYPNGIRHLHQYFVAQAGRYHVLGNVTRGVGRRAVYLGRIFTRESPAPVRTLTAVGIHDDLAARQAGITVWTTDHELTGRVDVVGNIFGK